jgi:hypothetical protein
MSNARWLTLSQVVRIALQMVSIFILSRLLAPSEYGLLAMATVAVNFRLAVARHGHGSRRDPEGDADPRDHQYRLLAQYRAGCFDCRDPGGHLADGGGLFPHPTWHRCFA